MPTPATERLANSYAASQQDLASRAAALVVAYWRKNPPSSRESADAWLKKAVPVIERARRQSGQLGQGFYKANRRLEVPSAPTMTLGALPSMDKKQVTSSLWVVGPREYVDLGRAVDDIFTEERITQIQGAVAKHTMNGGRQAIDDAFERDRLAVGYYRVEDSDPCSFCAMLMSRGIVYKEDSFDDSDARFFGPGDAKVHDHCGGGLAAAYTRDQQYPDAAKKHWDLWRELTGVDRNGRPIPPAVEFRQRYEGRY